MPLEPAFLFSHELLQNALPELLSQTGTTGRQFAQLLIRVWQETHHNDFPDIERAAESVGRRELPLSLERLHGICKRLGCHAAGSMARGASRAGGRCARASRRPTRCDQSRLRAPGGAPALRAGVFYRARLLHNGDGAGLAA